MASKSETKKKGLKSSKQSKRGLSRKEKAEGIQLESRAKYDFPIVTAETYNQFKAEPIPIPPDASKEERRAIRKEMKQRDNKIRSLANKHLKAYLRGRSSINILKRDEAGNLVSEPLKITSNEFRLHKKV